MNIERKDILSRTSYMQVIDTGSKVKVKNTTGFQWEIENPIIQNECKSANFFNKEEVVSRTRICEILESTNGAVFTVTFSKQITEEDILSKLLDIGLENTQENEGVWVDKNDYSLLTKEILKGEERTLIGYLIDTKQEFGRYKVIDLEVQFNDPKAHALRQVDSKTISELIYNSVKYKVKK